MQIKTCISPTVMLPTDARIAKRRELMQPGGLLHSHWHLLDTQICKCKGLFFLGDQPTLVDVVAFTYLSTFASGFVHLKSKENETEQQTNPCLCAADKGACCAQLLSQVMPLVQCIALLVAYAECTVRQCVWPACRFFEGLDGSSFQDFQNLAQLRTRFLAHEKVAKYYENAGPAWQPFLQVAV